MAGEKLVVVFNDTTGLRKKDQMRNERPVGSSTIIVCLWSSISSAIHPLLLCVLVRAVDSVYPERCQAAQMVDLCHLQKKLWQPQRINRIAARRCLAIVCADVSGVSNYLA